MFFALAAADQACFCFFCCRFPWQVGITEEEQASIFRLVASVMWLGNVTFEEQPDETVRVVEGAALGNVVELLRCERAALCKALTGRQIQAGRETIWQQLRLSQACDARDALSKALYSALFDWLVQRINASLGDAKRMQKALSINILDIYGFEHFKTNSFEQLCINFANERLQQQFNKYLFKLEQEEYGREGIDWAHVEFEDNQACVDLIEQKMPKGVGVISLLDEECVFPKATDGTYGEKLAAQLGSHPNFSSRSHTPNQFTVHHYAGPVTYTTDGFLDKNKDAISLDLLGALQGSSVPLLQGLAKAMAERQTAKNSLTVGSFFREQLRALVDTLESTQLHFVRCIKPNPEQAPLLLDNGLVLAQLRCCGVLEVVRIARAGYPTRYLHEQFADRYHILLPESAGGNKGPGKGGRGYDCPPLEMCQRILKQFQIDPAMYQVGHTKLFFRAGLLGRMEDTWERMISSACTIQAFMRMAVVRSAYPEAPSSRRELPGRPPRRPAAPLLRRAPAAAPRLAGARFALQGPPRAPRVPQDPPGGRLDPDGLAEAPDLQAHVCQARGEAAAREGCGQGGGGEESGGCEVGQGPGRVWRRLGGYPGHHGLGKAPQDPPRRRGRHREGPRGIRERRCRPWESRPEQLLQLSRLPLPLVRLRELPGRRSRHSEPRPRSFARTARPCWTT